MPRKYQSPLSPDGLDRLWDAMSTPADTTSAHASHATEASIIEWLHTAAPSVDSSRIDALRRRLDRSISAETAAPGLPMIGSDSTGARRMELTRQPSAHRLHTRPFGQFATAASVVATVALVVAIAAALAFAGPVRDFWQSSNDPDPGNGSGTGQSLAEFPLHSGRSLVSILVRPGDNQSGSATIGFWDIEMPPGSVLYIPAGIQEMGNQAIEAWVDDGAIIVGASGFEHEVAAGGTTAMEPAPEYFRNAGTDPARLLLLTPMMATEALPLRFTDWPGASTPPATPSIAADYAGTHTILFDSITLDDADAAQVRITVNADTYAPGDIIDPWAGPLERTTDKHSVTVWQGEATVNPAGDAATPQVRQVLAGGDTFPLDAAESEGSLLEATGPENLTLLTLESTPWSENPTLDQTVDAVAPFWGTWTVPTSGEINLAIRSLTLQPGARYELPSNAGIFYLVAEGDPITTNVSTGATGPLGPGSIVAQFPGEMLRFANESSSPVRLVQAIVFSGALDGVTAPEPTDGIVSEVLVQVAGTLPPGEASLMLQAHEFSGTNDGGSGGSESPSLVLMTAIDGAIEARRDGGDATVVSAPGREPNQPALGEVVAIAPGGYMLVQPQGAWAITGGTGEPSTGLVLTVSPMVDATAGSTPEATPEAEPGDTITLRGDPNACDVTPVTGSDVDNLMATPSVNDDPLARSARNRSDGIVDAETTFAITDMLQGYVNCAATGDYTRSSAFYSDQAIRESETMRNLIDSGHDVEDREGLVASVEDIVMFPDGLAGARAVIDGEAVYLTFVFKRMVNG